MAVIMSRLRPYCDRACAKSQTISGIDLHASMLAVHDVDKATALRPSSARPLPALAKAGEDRRRRQAGEDRARAASARPLPALAKAGEDRR